MAFPEVVIRYPHWFLVALCFLACLGCGESKDSTANAAPASKSGKEPASKTGRKRAPPDKPRNVLLIYVDTLRADHLEAYGYDKPTSPVIKKLAEKGALFTAAHSAAPWTYSSTASLVTGLYPAAHGAIVPGVVKIKPANGKQEKVDLAPGFQTMAEHFAAAGFKTALFAHNAHLGHGNEQGFETYRNVRKRIEASTQVKRALKWLKEQPKGAPFLLEVHFLDPHVKNDPTAASSKLFPAVAALDDAGRKLASDYRSGPDDTKPLNSPEFREQRIGMYDASIRDVDRAVGQLLKGLGRHRRDTLVVFTADHGEELWDHEKLEQSLYSDLNGVYGVGHGHTMFEELMHVPLIVSMPGFIKPASINDQVSLVDVLPTLLDLTGLLPAANLDGRTLRPLLEGRTLPARPLLFDSPLLGRDKQGILSGRWKFVRSDSESDLLVDLKEDPLETTNVAALHPDEVKRLRALLDAALAASRARGDGLRSTTPVIHEMEPDELQDLKELGYVK